MPQLHMPGERPHGAAVAAVHEEMLQDAFDHLGEGHFNRRLTDKILAAFNHAYSTGSFEVAAILREALERTVAGTGETGSERRRNAALAQADLWVKYVNARNAFRSATDPESGANPETVDVALDRMKDAYRRWSAS
jgi:hypothetical protein